jgi:hypothetical protein
MTRVPVNQINHSDCVQGMKQLPDKCIPLTVTSPPYDGMRSYGCHIFDAKEVIQQLWRTTAEGGIVVWVVQDQVVNGNLTATSAEHQLAFKNAGFWLHDTIIMTRAGACNASLRSTGVRLRVFQRQAPCRQLADGPPQQIGGKEDQRQLPQERRTSGKGTPQPCCSGIRRSLWHMGIPSWTILQHPRPDCVRASCHHARIDGDGFHPFF